MEQLFNIFKDNNTNSSILKGAKAALTVESANEILIKLFGQNAINFVEAIYLKNRTLGIKVSGTTAANEVKMAEKQIITKINDIYGENSVEFIRFST